MCMLLMSLVVCRCSGSVCMVLNIVLFLMCMVVSVVMLKKCC